RERGERTKRNAGHVEFSIESLQPISPPKENQPRQCNVRRLERPSDVAQLRLGNPEIDWLVMQISKDQIREHGKKRLSCDHPPAAFQLVGRTVKKRNRTF